MKHKVRLSMEYVSAFLVREFKVDLALTLFGLLYA
jgi:hypothetical protein